MGDRPLTVPGALATLLAIVMFAAVLPAFGANIEPDVRLIGRVVFFASTIAFVSCIIWHAASRNAKTDAQPDILGDLFDDAQIMQWGACHIVVSFTQSGSLLRTAVVVQNRFDVAAVFELRLEFKWKNKKVPDPFLTVPPPLRLDLAPGAVELAVFDAGLRMTDRPLKVRAEPYGHCRVTERGAAVRFARRTVLRDAQQVRNVGALATVLGAAGEPVTLWEVQLTPDYGRPPHPQTAWETTPLWRPDTPYRITAIRETVAEVMHS